MTPPPATAAAPLKAALAAYGLIPRGGFRPSAADRVPALRDGRPARSLMLIGNAGPAMWPAFARARRAGPDPMNEWTRRVIDPIAADLGAEAVYPFQGPPYLPFQAWARRAEPVAASPIGMLIHPLYGLWHAYRAALLFRDALDLPARQDRPSPCEGCADKPCLAACPVGAFSGSEYDVGSCTRHLDLPAGHDCMSLACRARRACPVGQDYRYLPVQADFHMTAFRAARLNSK